MEKLKRCFSLLLFFMKIGCFTFGGGWSLLAQMEKEFVDRRKWITKEELLDIVSVGKSIPGIMITNISMIFGYRMEGYIGGFICVIGITIPAIVILSIVTYFYDYLKNNYWVSAALTGIRAAVPAIVFSSVWSMGKTIIKDKKAYVIFPAAFIICYFTDWNRALIILGGVILALVMMGVKKDAA